MTNLHENQSSLTPLIVLRPDSNDDGYADLVFDDESVGELNVVGEFVAVIG